MPRARLERMVPSRRGRHVLVQISATCKQTIYKQTGWRGAPELSNGAGCRQRAQAMAAKQCRLCAAGGKKI